MRTALFKLKGHVHLEALVGMRFKALIFEDYPNMNEKLISRLVMGALVGLAATGAYAGQIQASSVSIAREVITTNTQAVTAPSISYRFSGDLDARIQAQTFQVQFNLSAAAGAAWASIGTASGVGTGTQPTTSLLATGAAIGVATIPLFPQLSITDGVSGVRISQKDTVATAGTAYSVDTLALSADGKTLFATITVNQNAANLIKQPIISISASAVSADNPTVKNLYDVVGAVGECDTTVKTLPVDFKHFTALAAPASLATTSNATADEHVRGGSTNTATLITFPTNILVAVGASSGNAKVNVAASGLSFAGSATAPATGAAAPDSYISATLVNLGRVSLTQQASGYDSNLANQYLIAGSGTGLSGVATAAVKNGVVEAAKVDVTVTASQGLAVSANAAAGLWLDSSPTCSGVQILSNAGAKTKITSTNAAGPITLSIGAAQLGGVNGAFDTSGFDSLNVANATPGVGPAYVCYDVTGTAAPIPGSSFNVTAATVVKAAAGADLNEQNNYCKGPLYALSGSIKIDVRNYANSSRTDGWQSVIRLINNSETRTAAVYGQYIHADGKYGKWGKLADLAPRAVLNMTPSQVDAKLTSTPAHATAANNAGATDLPHNATTGDSPRLRITSETGDTLRVQNYLYNPASENFIEASSSQGVDFTGVSDRAPASEGQYQDQDAQKGLNGGN